MRVTVPPAAGLFLVVALLAPAAFAVRAQSPSPVPPSQPQAASPLRWQNFSQPSSQPETPPPPRPKVEAASDYMARMDADGDGRISLAEYVDWMSYAFDERDRDRDGVLSADELPGGKGQPITRTQHRERIAERFGRQDSDHDGWLSAKELAAPPL